MGYGESNCHVTDDVTWSRDPSMPRLTAFTDMLEIDRYCIKGALALFVLVSFSG